MSGPLGGMQPGGGAGGALVIPTLAHDPWSIPATGTLAYWSGHLYVHTTKINDNAWLLVDNARILTTYITELTALAEAEGATTIPRAVTLENDPRGTAAAGTFAWWSGLLFVHVETPAIATTAWLLVNDARRLAAVVDPLLDLAGAVGAVVRTARAVIDYTAFIPGGGAPDFLVPLTGLLPAGARPIRARLLLRTTFVGVTTANLGLGTIDTDGHGTLVREFDATGAVGSQGTVGTGDPYDQDSAAINLNLHTDGHTGDLTAGEVSVQIDYLA